MWEKSEGTTKYEKKTVTCDKNRTDALLVLFNITIELSNLRKKNKGTTICDKKKPSNVILELHNVIMELSMWGKNKRTTKYVKRTITYDVRITQCGDGTDKCDNG